MVGIGKIILIIGIIGVLFLFGLDAFLINTTVNRPDFSCSIDTDCDYKYIEGGGSYDCPTYNCINNEWNYQKPAILSVFGLSCVIPPDTGCICNQNICQRKTPENCVSIDNVQKKDECFEKLIPELGSFVYPRDYKNETDQINYKNEMNQICSSISDPNIREECQIVIDFYIEGDLEEIICSQNLFDKTYNEFRIHDQNECFSKLALQKSDPALCLKYDEILDNELGCITYLHGYTCPDQSTWLIRCLRDIAEKEKDVQLCNEISNNLSASNCLKDVGISSGNVEICETLDNKLRNSCYYNNALNLQDPELCSEVSTEGSEFYCYFEIGRSKSDIEVCKRIPVDFDPEVDTTGCLANRERTECDNLRHRCLAQVASDTKDETICNEISEEDVNIKELCILWVATAKVDPSLCDLAGSKKETCLEWTD